MLGGAIVAKIYDLLAQFQQVSLEFLNHFCMINGAVYPLDEVEKMGYAEFGLRARINMPKRLYKYFPNMRKEVRGDSGEVTSVNYSLDALKSSLFKAFCKEVLRTVIE